jgi:hypothetical protein
MKSFSAENIRREYFTIAGINLNECGFSHDRKLTIYKKTTENGNVFTIKVECYKYSLKTNFRLMLMIKNVLIDRETRLFNAFINQEYNNEPTFIFSEYDLNPTTNLAEPKYRTSFMHVVHDETTCKKEVWDSSQVLLNHIIPQLTLFDNLSLLTQYIKDDFQRIFKMGILFQTLVAFKIQAYKNLAPLYSYIWKYLKMDDLSDLNSNKIWLKEFKKYSNI